MLTADGSFLRSKQPTTLHSVFIVLTLDGFSLPLTREVAQLVCDGGRDCIGRIDGCVSSRRHFSPSVSFADTLRQREPIRNCKNEPLRDKARKKGKKKK